MHRLGTNAQAIMIALERHVFHAPAMPQLDEWSKLLGPIARHAPADRKYSQPLLRQHGGCEMFQILKRVEPELWFALLRSHAVGQRKVQAEFRIRERRHEHRNVLLVSRFQDAAAGAMFGQ